MMKMMKIVDSCSFVCRSVLLHGYRLDGILLMRIMQGFRLSSSEVSSTGLSRFFESAYGYVIFPEVL